MDFDSLKSSILQLSTDKNFDEATCLLEKIIFDISKAEFIPIIIEIGCIPECIQIDSSAEKLYSKASEIVLARCFQELGLASQVIKIRSNCADVIARSRHHNYSLVADAKSFRLSRTAKNQKDFKVESMVSWKGDNDYAVLACPYFQYPRKASQIYTQALDGNVLLFSWEHLSFLIKNSIIENESRNLVSIWNMSHVLASRYTRADKKIVFLNQQ
ncbi:MAG: HindIII family type II restriction endonuclease, partial [Proteobacteria bacterium]|nr:HindIII family type II restriction endonuclease [Pseudomonadota bacterium]